MNCYTIIRLEINTRVGYLIRQRIYQGDALSIVLFLINIHLVHICLRDPIVPFLISEYFPFGIADKNSLIAVPGYNHIRLYLEHFIWTSE